MNYLRTLVSGKKKRFIDRKYNLDLSYITPRIIAMAYPGSGFETVFRNNINQVSTFLNERHQENYLVINLSGKKYDNNKFNNKMHSFLLENVENVVTVNCRAGKGRTGTIICCYLLFSRRFEDPEEVLQYYSKKRFNIGEGVTQPSQRRYVYYFSQLLKEKIYFPLVRTLKAISVNKLVKKNSETIKPYFEIYLGNSDKLFYTNKTSYLDQKKIFSNNTDLITITDSNFGIIVSGDMTIKLYNNGMLSSKKLGRVAFNTAFLKRDQNVLVFKIQEVDPDNLAKKKKVPKDFEIHFKFGILCECNNTESAVNLCSACSDLLVNELNDWKEINMILEKHFYNSKEDFKMLLFGKFEEDDVEQVLNGTNSDGEVEIQYIDDGDVNTNSIQEPKKQGKKDPEKKDDDANTSFENECVIY